MHWLTSYPLVTLPRSQVTVAMLVLAPALLSSLLVSGLSSTSSIIQKFVREPPDQTAAEGEHVTLPCRVDNKVALSIRGRSPCYTLALQVGPLQWTRDDFGLGLNRNLKGFER